MAAFASPQSFRKTFPRTAPARKCCVHGLHTKLRKHDAAMGALSGVIVVLEKFRVGMQLGSCLKHLKHVGSGEQPAPDF